MMKSRSNIINKACRQQPGGGGGARQQQRLSCRGEIKTRPRRGCAEEE